MRTICNATLAAGVLALATFSALAWRAQLQTQQKLDALAAELEERRAVPVPPTPVQAAPPEKAKEPVQLEIKNTEPPYAIEAPDVLTIEAALRDPKTGKLDRLPTQPISGRFMVRPDGNVSLGAWGALYVSGLTLEQAAKALKVHLAKFDVPAESLVVTVDVLAYNSKAYYVITDFRGDGEQVSRLPLTGNETVIDAVSQIGAVEEAKTRAVRVVRNRGAHHLPQELPVDWTAITRDGVTHTNYQLKSGDRVYVTARK